MQLLYGNDGMNYRTIAKSSELTQEQERELLHSYLGYSFIKNKEAYSSVEYEPVALSYVTTNLAGTLPQEIILLSKTSRISNYSTPSYCAHFQLWEREPNCYGENFLDILQYSFIQDTDVAQYMHRDIDEFDGRPQAHKNIADDRVEKEKRIVLVSALLQAADSLSGQVRVILDVNGDEYNRRALEVLAAVFAYIPYTLRRQIGFSTYAGPETNTSGRIKLQLYTREAIGLLGEQALDLERMNTEEELLKLPAEVTEFVRSLAESKQEKRKEWFEVFQTVFGIHPATVQEHISFYQNINRWNKEEIEGMKEELAAYAWRESTREKKSPVFKIFCELMEKRFRQENFDERYVEILQEMLREQKSLSFDRRMKAYLMLGEVVPCLQIPPDMFVKWLDETVLSSLSGKCEEKEALIYLKKQYEAMEKTQNVGEKFAEVKKQMEACMMKRLYQLQKEIEKKIQSEAEKIESYLQRIRMVPENKAILEQLKTNIKYEENQEIYEREVRKGVAGYLEQRNYFISYKKFTEYQTFYLELNLSIPDVGHRENDEVLCLMQEKGKGVVEVEKCRSLVWKNKEDLLGAYKQCAAIEAQLALHTEIEFPDYRLEIGGSRAAFQKESMKWQDIELLLEFVFCFREEQEKRICELFWHNRGLLEALLYMNVLGGEHFACLMDAGYKEGLQRKVLEHYIGNEVPIRKEQAQRGIEKAEWEMQKQVSKSMTAKGILYQTLVESVKMKRGRQMTWKKNTNLRARWNK